MNKEKNKHDHKLTNLLKVGIFALLMVAPLFASVTQWMYATINKNAYKNYSGTQYSNVENYNNIANNENEIFYIQSRSNYNAYNGGTSFNFDINISNVNVIENGSNIALDTCNKIRFYLFDGTPNNTYYVFFNDDTQIGNFYSQTYSFLIECNINSISDIARLNTYLQYNHPITYQTGYNSLDNSFYYGVEKMTNSDLFNWTENTTIYTGIKGMTDNLEIQTNAIAILLTYWTILTIVYVIFDILIQGFTFITHKIVE